MQTSCSNNRHGRAAVNIRGDCPPAGLRSITTLAVAVLFSPQCSRSIMADEAPAAAYHCQTNGGDSGPLRNNGSTTCAGDDLETLLAHIPRQIQADEMRELRLREPRRADL